MPSGKVCPSEVTTLGHGVLSLVLWPYLEVHTGWREPLSCEPEAVGVGLGGKQGPREEGGGGPSASAPTDVDSELVGSQSGRLGRGSAGTTPLAPPAIGPPACWQPEKGPWRDPPVALAVATMLTHPRATVLGVPAGPGTPGLTDAYAYVP